MSSASGPPLESLTRRLAETPAAFLREPVLKRGGQVAVAAVVSDVLADFGVEVDAKDLRRFQARGDAERNWLRLVLVAAWLSHAPSLRSNDGAGAGVARFLLEGLTRRAELVQADRFVDDPERREELARCLLAAIGLRPAGESERQAADRLSTVDTVARAELLESTRARRERARALREAMRRRRAQEAAARYGRE